MTGPTVEWPTAEAFLRDVRVHTEIGRRAASVTLDSHLLDDLHADSLGLAELSVVLHAHGAVLADDDWLDIQTLGDVWFHYGFRRSNPVAPA